MAESADLSAETLARLEHGLQRVELLLTHLTTGEHPRRTRSVDQAVQRLLAAQYRGASARGERVALADTELRFFSQNGEDGILLYLLSAIGMTTRRSVEICAGDGIECNTANLIVNHGFDALLVDGAKSLLERGKHFYEIGDNTWFYPPKLVQTWVTAETINDLVLKAGFEDEIDVLSLDMDGIDWWVWQALECIQPRVVVAEFNSALGPDVSWVVPYEPDFSLSDQRKEGDTFYFGGSLRAYVELARRRGLRLVGVQRYGFNAFFVRNGLAEDVLPEIDPATCFNHPDAVKRIESFTPVRELFPWVTV